MHDTSETPAAIQVNLTNSATGRRVAASSFAAALALGLGLTAPGTEQVVVRTAIGARRSTAAR